MAQNGIMRFPTILKKYLAFALSAAFLHVTFAAASTRVLLARAADDKSGSNKEAALDWRVTGPFGGDVRSLVIDPKDPQRLYFGTLDGQIYTSGDGGATWQRLAGFNRPGLIVDHIIVDSRDSKVLYAAAHRHIEPGGVFKSKDGGLTWRAIPDMRDQDVHSLAQSSANPDMLLAGTFKGMYRSMDSGETWQPVESTTTPRKVESIAIDPRDTNIVYAGTWELPYKTSDGGSSWQIIKDGMIDDSDVFAIEIDHRNPDHVIASACSGIYETKTAGRMWRKVQGIPSQSRRTRAILQNPGNPNLVYAGTTEGFWLSNAGGADGSWRLTTSRQLEVNAIAVHPQNPDIVYIGTNNNGVMISRDGGKSFAPSNDGYSGRRALAILPDRERPERIYAATLNTARGGGYFFVSDDGGATWQPSMRDLSTRVEAYSILQDRNNPEIIYLGTNFGLYRSTDRGASWQSINTIAAAAPARRAPRSRRGVTRRSSGAAARGRTTQTARRSSASSATILSAQKALIDAGYDIGGAADGRAGARTIAAAKKFQTDHNLPATGRFDAATLAALGISAPDSSAVVAQSGDAKALTPLTFRINALTYDYSAPKNQTVLLAATSIGLYRTRDPLRGWEKISYGSGLDPNTLCISTNAQSPSEIWVGTATSNVLVSRDAGATWQQVSFGADEPVVPVNTIVQEAQRPGHIYVGTKRTLFVSRDDGASWKRRGGNLPFGDFTSVIINPQNSNEIYAGSALEFGGVFHSMDAGTTWERVDPQLPSRRVWTLAFDARDPGKIFVGSHSAGIYVAQRENRAAN